MIRIRDEIRDKVVGIIFIIFFVSVALGAAYMLSYVYDSLTFEIPEYDYYYEMPNGVICNFSDVVESGWGAATHEFRSCQDGKIYINPDFYKETTIITYKNGTMRRMTH